MILLLHNRYRTLGGEERVVDDLKRLIPEYLDEPVEVLQRDSGQISSGSAALGLTRGGLDPSEVADAVRRSGARVVHAHNLQPSLGWRALAAARQAGARTVLTLHQYRLVCAAGTCLDSAGQDCTRCQGRDTRPGVRLNCRGGSRAEAALYAASLARWSGRLVAEADALTVPSDFALGRLRELQAPIGGRNVAVVANPVYEPAQVANAAAGEYALCASRLTADNGVELAIEACARINRPLVVAGDGPELAALQQLAARLSSEVRFVGRQTADQLTALRAAAAVAVVPSRFAESFGLSAAEAMAAALPVVGFDVGALGGLLAAEQLAAPGDVDRLAELISKYWGDAALGRTNSEKIARLASPQIVAEQLASLYDG